MAIVILIVFLIVIVCSGCYDLQKDNARKRLALLLGIDSNDVQNSPPPEVIQIYRDRISVITERLKAEQKEAMNDFKTAEGERLKETQKRLNRIAQKLKDIGVIRRDYLSAKW